MFTTERLILRPFRDDDADEITRMRNIAVVQRNVSTEPTVPLSSKYSEETHKNVANSLIYVIITLKESGKFVGTSRIAKGNTKNRDGFFGVCMLPDYWHKGYGKEVSEFIVDYGFKWLGLHRVSLQVVEGNKRAVALYEKLGFVLEGTERKANWADGQWEDIYAMGVLETEWAERYVNKTGTE